MKQHHLVESEVPFEQTQYGKRKAAYHFCLQLLATVKIMCFPEEAQNTGESPGFCGTLTLAIPTLRG